MLEHKALLETVAVVVALNFAVSIAVAASAGYTLRQKLMQIALVWAVPLLGSVVFGLFLWSQRGQGAAPGYPAQPQDDAGHLWSASHPPDDRP